MRTTCENTKDPWPLQQKDFLWLIFHVNFLNPFCLLILLVFFFSLNFFASPYSLSIPGCPWKPCPSSTLLSIACPMSLCIDLSYALSAQSPGFSGKPLPRTVHGFSCIKSSIHVREKLSCASKRRFFTHNGQSIIC